jgi:hypothetical protein
MSSAAAGSMEPSNLDAVQFIHLSACQYFLTGGGFKLLGQTVQPACFGAGHVYIAATCLRYTQLEEMKPLIPSRPESFAHLQDGRITLHDNSSGTSLSEASFGSSAASSVRRSTLPTPAPPSTSKITSYGPPAATTTSSVTFYNAEARILHLSGSRRLRNH